MSHRARAGAFAATAALCAAMAAASAGGSSDDGDALGSLREVVVATESLDQRRVLDRERIEASLEVRRIPEAFAAPDALSDPAQALGRRPAAPIPAGAYLVGSQLLSPRQRPTPAQGDIGAGHTPVEITVSAAGPLAGAVRQKVDVVVTGEPTTGAGGGRTYVAARGVALLELRPADAGSDPAASAVAGAGTELSVATLALTRAQALRLIHAQSFAREVRLIAS